MTLSAGPDLEWNTRGPSEVKHDGIVNDLPSPVPGVFLIINSLEIGGSERQFVELARSLDPNKYHLELGCLQPKGGFLGSLGAIHHFGIGGSLYRLHSMRTRYRLAQYLRRHRTAVAHAFDFYANLTLIPAARLAGVPVVIGSQRQLGDLLTPAQARAQNLIFRCCDGIICNSQAAAAELRKQGLPAEKVCVIGNGLSPSLFAETAAALPKTAGLFRVAMIARMNTPAKNHLSLLRAVAKVPRSVALEVLFVGDGPLRSGLEREANALGIMQNVVFLGDRADIPAILASVDATVLPSSSESLSNAILESMAAGVPVIATDVGGNRELLADGRGILIPAGSDTAMAQALEQIAADGMRRERIGRKARTYAFENFTIEHMRRRHEEFYAELLERKNWRPKLARSIGLQGRSVGSLRVAIVAASLRYVGGQSVQADLLLRHWRDDESVSATLIPIDPPLPRMLSWAERIPGLRTIVRQPFYLAALWRGLKHAHIAHIFSASYWSFLIAPLPAWIIARLQGKKTLVHYHSGEARDHFRRFRSAVPLLHRMGTLVVPSGYLVDVFREFGLNAEVVPNVVDLSQFSFRLRQPLRPHLICTRGFHPYYRVDLVVRAFAEVCKHYPNARLDLVGGGPSEQEIRRLVAELNLSGIHFLGVVPYSGIAHLYDAADLFVNASSLDNMPVSVLEGFASGTPVISTAPEGMTYLVEDERTGLLSPPGDANALAANILRVLGDANLATRLAKNAREELQRYCWDTVREQWLTTYRKMVTPAVQRSEETMGVAQ
jgi:L-malate glycosyltransferase